MNEDLSKLEEAKSKAKRTGLNILEETLTSKSNSSNS